MGAVKAEEGFITAVAPGSFGRRQNEYYKTDEEFLFALADALKEEYKAIIDAGFVLQIDDPGLPDNWDMANPEPVARRLQEIRACSGSTRSTTRSRGLPEDRIRYHICWGSWHGPHTTDVPLADHRRSAAQGEGAGAFSVEAGNVRHEHEWKIWRDVKLPRRQDLDARRRQPRHQRDRASRARRRPHRPLRQVAGRENVIAGTDCGLGGRIHADLAWAKLEALVEGAKLATKQLWG